MWAPVGSAQEETAGMLVCMVDGEPPPNLDPIDFAILGNWGSNWSEIARRVGISTAQVRERAKRPAFQNAQTRLQRNFFDQLARGEYGALSLAKANTIGNMKRLLDLARNAQSENVKFNAICKMLEYGSIVPPKPATVERPETLLDQMTAEELDHFARTNEFPRRLADKLARVAATVFEKRETATVDADSWEVVGGPDQIPAAPTETPPPREINDDDGPAWGPLPDETEDSP